MVIQKKTPNLLVLLEFYTEGTTLEVLVDSKPPTPLARSSPTEPGKTKRKRVKRSGKEIFEEGKIQSQVD